jgi:2-keto-4-pentenoate hydratase
MAFEKEMKILVDAENRGSPVGPISDLTPGGLTLGNAQRICEGNIDRRLKAGEKIAGYKVGFTNVPAREKMGLPDSTYGYIMDTMVLESGSELRLDDLIAAKIECEICFKLNKGLGGQGLTARDVLEATEGVSAAFEICDARIKDWQCPYPDIFADNGFSARIVLPGTWHPVSEVDLINETVVLLQNGNELAEGKGEMAMGHPANAVAWLAGKLAGRGRSLEAGQTVMTGTLTPIMAIEKGATYLARYSSLGEVTIKFV